MNLIDANERLVVSISRDELVLIANSINEALEVVEEWEFSARLGASREDAQNLKTELRELVAQLSGPK